VSIIPPPAGRPARARRLGGRGRRLRQLRDRDALRIPISDLGQDPGAVGRHLKRSVACALSGHLDAGQLPEQACVDHRQAAVLSPGPRPAPFLPDVIRIGVRRRNGGGPCPKRRGDPEGLEVGGIHADGHGKRPVLRLKDAEVVPGRDPPLRFMGEEMDLRLDAEQRPVRPENVRQVVDPAVPGEERRPRHDGGPVAGRQPREDRPVDALDVGAGEGEDVGHGHAAGRAHAIEPRQHPQQPGCGVLGEDDEPRALVDGPLTEVAHVGREGVAICVAAQPHLDGGRLASAARPVPGRHAPYAGTQEQGRPGDGFPHHGKCFR